MRKGSIWVLGDFNFPKFSWDSEHVTALKPGCRYPTIYNTFISSLDDYGLVQMVSKPTRGDNILDLFLTSNHTLVNKVEILPGISDHEISISNISVKPKMSRKKPRSVPIYRKADWDSFKSYMATKSSEILCRFQESTVEEIWNALKTALDSGIQQFIHIKKISSKCSLPWITLEIRRLMRKRDKLYQNKNQYQTRIGVISSGLSILCSKKLIILMKITWQTYSGWVLVTGMNVLEFLQRNSLA